MSAKFVCDGCGVEAPAFVNHMGDVFKPGSWFSRYDKETGRQDACCRDCIKRAAEKHGVHDLVLPI